LPDSLEILQAVIDSYDQPVFALDRELRYIAFNRMAADGMRAIYGAEITLGGRLTDYQTETADRRSALTNLTKALAGERIVAGGYSGEKGRRRYYDFTHIPLTDAGGEVYGVVVRADDLTEQRAATSGLQASEERLHRSLAAAKAGTWEWDTASGANTWSEELWELYDLERDGREPSYDLWLESIHPDDRHAAATRVADAAAAGDEVDTEWRVNTRDGSLRWLVSRGSPVRDADDTVVRYLGVVMDITRRKEAEMALHRSRGELRALVDSFPDIVFQIDRDRRLVVANAPFEQAIVTSGGAPIAPGDPILPPDYPEEFRALWRGHYDRAFGGESFAVETTVPMTDGAHLMESHLTPVRSDGDEVTGVVITSRDITERRRAEQELRDSEARFRAYFEQSLIGAAVTSPAMAWIDVNEATCDLLGYSREELLKLTWQDLTHPEDLAEDLAQFDRILAGEIDEYRLQKRYLRKDGAVVWVDRSVRCHRGEDGSVDYLLSLLADITGLKQTEGELTAMHDRLDLAQRASGAGTWDWHVASGDIEWSPEMFGLFGLDAEKDDAGFDAWDRALHPDDLEAAHARIATALADHTTLDSEYRVVWPTGEVRWINALGHGIYDDRGDPVRMSGICIDVTQRKHAEDAIRRLNAGLERRVEERTRDLTAANAELEDFVHSIAHDLRSPLRALSGFSELVEADYSAVIDDTGRDYLRRIRDAAGHLGRLMDALLSLSQIGRRELEPRDVDLSALARDVAEELAASAPTRPVDFEIEDGLVAPGDPALCEIIVQNLLGNAWKFSAGEAPALIRFGAERVDDRRVFCVADNGVGFDPAYADKLFVPSERLHTTDEFPGIGIGLATVRRAVTRLGGTCWADAEHGGGARVYFTLGEPG